MSQARIRNWRLRAEELRIVAAKMRDPLAQRGMLNAAATYDALADGAEREDSPSDQPPSNRNHGEPRGG